MSEANSHSQAVSSMDALSGDSRSEVIVASFVPATSHSKPLPRPARVERFAVSRRNST
jgi:hypothetical protein